MAELDSTHQARQEPLTVSKIRATREWRNFPDYEGDMDSPSEVRTRAFAAGSEAVPTNGITAVRTAPDCSDTFKRWPAIQGRLAFDSGAGQTADLYVYALCLSNSDDVDATGTYTLVGMKTGIGHEEEFDCPVSQRPVRFRVVNATDDGDIYWAPM